MAVPIAGGVGLGSIRGEPTGTADPVSYFPDLLPDLSGQAWTSLRSWALQNLPTFLGKGDLITAGVTLYNLDVRLPESPPALAVAPATGGGLTFELTTERCTIIASSTTPTVLGRAFDPRFSLDFTLQLRFVLDVPWKVGPLQVRDVEVVRVLDPKIDSQNLVADVLFVIDAIVAWFRGERLVRELERALAAMDLAEAANSRLGPLNDRLRTLAADGFWHLDHWIDRLDGRPTGTAPLSLTFDEAPRDRMDLVLVARGWQFDGILEGMATWDRALGTPVHRATAAREGVEKLPVGSLLASAHLGRLAAAPQAFIAASGETDLAEAVTSFVTEAGPLTGSAVDEGRALAGPAGPADEVTRSAVDAFVRADPAGRAQLVADVRAGVATRVVELLGGADRFRLVVEAIRRTTNDLVLVFDLNLGGPPGSFGRMTRKTAVTTVWEDDDAQHHRRRFVAREVVIGERINPRIRLAPAFVWAGGEVSEVVSLPDGWAGAVLVRPASERPSGVDARFEQVIDVQVSGVSRRIRASELVDAGLSEDVVSKGISGGDLRSSLEQVLLNPQPLPPREPVRSIGTDKPAPRVDLTRGMEGIRVARGSDAGAGDAGLIDVSSIDAGSIAAEIERLGSRPRAAPTGYGRVEGVDFRLVPAVDPVVR